MSGVKYNYGKMLPNTKSLALKIKLSKINDSLSNSIYFNNTPNLPKLRNKRHIATEDPYESKRYELSEERRY